MKMLFAAALAMFLFTSVPACAENSENHPLASIVKKVDEMKAQNKGKLVVKCDKKTGCVYQSSMYVYETTPGTESVLEVERILRKERYLIQYVTPGFSFTQ